ncbi:DNA polymerase II subunit D [Hyphodiscus hymeniophilus]|uniref:DNA polymerase epsilon subunit D n=1 Tax=Hyphodiscus hymeniophilus TaxID=353542 RepID=A0A9P6VL74_9HELO|nr:DNA polymerase II subunit D [Hyphodiscus hymeniophilus]
MPPRKSLDTSKMATGDEGIGTPAKELSSKEGVNIEDLNLPKSIVTRLAKGVLPANTQIQGNAMLAMSKSATVFVSYLATQKTIAPQDVLAALDDLEFPEFKPRLEAELARFVELQTDKRNTYRKKVAADKASGKVGSPPPGEEESYVEGDHDGEGMDGDGQPVAKKARMDREGATREGDVRDMQRDEDIGEGEGEGEEDESGEEPEDEEEEGDEVEERQETDEQIEEEQHEAEDEALDNGEDSD